MLVSGVHILTRHLYTSWNDCPGYLFLEVSTGLTFEPTQNPPFETTTDMVYFEKQEKGAACVSIFICVDRSYRIHWETLPLLRVIPPIQDGLAPQIGLFTACKELFRENTEHVPALTIQQKKQIDKLTHEATCLMHPVLYRDGTIIIIIIIINNKNLLHWAPRT